VLFAQLIMGRPSSEGTAPQRVKRNRRWAALLFFGDVENMSMPEEHGHTVIACDQCGKIFSQFNTKIRRSIHHFCSKTCYSAWQSDQGEPEALVSGERIELTCDYCGKVFWRKKSARRDYLKNMFCSWKCYGEWRKGRFVEENSPSWAGGRRRYGAGWTELLRDEVRKLDMFCCQRCGKMASDNGRELDVHHITASRDGGEHKPENLVALCRSCHQRVEAMGIDFELPRRCQQTVLALRDI